MISQALARGYANSLCLLEPVAASSGVDSLDGAPFVPSNETSTLPLCWLHDKTTGIWKHSRYGQTYAHLTDDLGADLLTWYQGASRAKTSQSRVRGQDSMGNEADCGESSHESSEKSNPPTCSLKTAPCLSRADLTWFSQTLHKWGTMRAGVLYPQVTSVPHTSASVYGFMLPTPVASDATSGAVLGKNDTYYTTSTGMPRKVNQKGTDGSVGLGRLVQMWPTPCARDGKGARGNSKPRDSLDYAVERGVTKKKTYPVPPPTGQLNPQFVEWLMGWPTGWTDLKPLGMDKSHSVQL